MHSYLIRLTPRAGDLATGGLRFSTSPDIVVALLTGFKGSSGFLNGEGAACSAWTAALYLSSNSPIVTLRKATGMRLMRRSRRARRSCAWRAYCARSLRARSVTCGLSAARSIKEGGGGGSPSRSTEDELTLKLQVVYKSLFLPPRDSQLLPGRTARGGRRGVFIVLVVVWLWRLPFPRQRRSHWEKRWVGRKSASVLV